MSTGIRGAERKRCPVEFQNRITRMFGVNRFGQPNFRISWGQTEKMRIGVDGKYREILVQFNQPCWMIQRWKEAREYGSPALYYSETWDGNCYITGEYPWTGRYETLQPMYRKEFENGKMKIIPFPLSHILIDKVIPMMLKAQQLTFWEKRAAQDMQRELEHKAEVENIADMLEEDRPSWTGPVSFSRQGCRTSRLDKKMEEIQRYWNRISADKKQWKRGFFQGSKLYN